MATESLLLKYPRRYLCALTESRAERALLRIISKNLCQSAIGIQSGGFIGRLVLRLEHSSDAFAWSTSERWDRIA